MYGLAPLRHRARHRAQLLPEQRELVFDARWCLGVGVQVDGSPEAYAVGAAPSSVCRRKACDRTGEGLAAGWAVAGRVRGDVQRCAARHQEDAPYAAVRARVRHVPGLPVRARTPGCCPADG
ncbi:hypothetical protein [Streptomyces europaeiscabiei]|uniref:hypothetical protein n=1 Tax=Streptomyces europaeiscabiei TaxID=146819 RepID=UPI0038F6CA7C